MRLVQCSRALLCCAPCFHRSSLASLPCISWASKLCSFVVVSLTYPCCSLGPSALSGLQQTSDLYSAEIKNLKQCNAEAGKILYRNHCGNSWRTSSFLGVGIADAARFEAAVARDRQHSIRFVGCCSSTQCIPKLLLCCFRDS